MVDIVVAVLAAGLIGVLVIASRRAVAGKSQAQVLAVLAGGGLVLAAAIATFFALAFAGIKCDEGCDQGLEGATVSWSEDPDAWQWWGQLVLALIGLVVAVIAWRLIARQRHRQAIPCALVAAALLAGWVGFVSAGM